MNKAIIDYTVHLSSFIAWNRFVMATPTLPTGKVLLAALHLFDQADTEVGSLLSRNSRLTNRMLVLRSFATAIRSNKAPFGKQNLSQTIDFHSTTAEHLADLLGCLVKGDVEGFTLTSYLVTKDLKQPTGELNLIGEIAYAGVTSVMEKWYKAATTYAIADNVHQDNKSNTSMMQAIIEPSTLMHIQV